MTTIKDVARRAGVAPSTVSNFLTGHARVSPPTAERIQEAIDALGYIPNMAARSLRINQTKTIGLIVPDISNPFFSEIVRTIGHVSQRMEYALLLGDSAEDGDREKELLSNLLSQRVDGILMIHTGRRSDYDELAENASRPIVFVDREVKGRPSIVTDNRAGGRMAARHLLGFGHRRIGMLVGNAHVQNVQERIEGFVEEVKDHGLSIDPSHIISGDQTLETGRDIAFLLKMKEPPTAVFATNDIIALGAWRTLVEMGMRIPEEMSLIGFDNIEMTEMTVPTLTTVSQDKNEMGRQAVLALLESLEDRERTGTTSYVTPQLMVRNSTGMIGKETK